MKTRFILCLTTLLASCQSIQHSKVPVPQSIIKQVTPAVTQTRYKKITCRVTYYTPDKRWGKLVADPKVKEAIQGVTVAAHPDFKFGTKISIPRLKGILDDGLFLIQDRGSAVTKKTASRGKAYVIDIYLASPKSLKFYTKLPAYMDVYFAKPE